MLDHYPQTFVHSDHFLIPSPIPLFLESIINNVCCDIRAVIFAKPAHNLQQFYTNKSLTPLSLPLMLTQLTNQVSPIICASVCFTLKQGVVTILSECLPKNRDSRLAVLHLDPSRPLRRGCSVRRLDLTEEPKKSSRTRAILIRWALVRALIVLALTLCPVYQWTSW